MNKQKVLADARETAEVLLEQHTFERALRHVTAAMNAEANDPTNFWSRVWDALYQIKRGEA